MPRRILIIDNEPHICESLKDRLEAEGHEAIVAHDGPTALALIALEAKRGPIGGVLLDVHMPVMDGLEVLRELRSRYPDLPILMMSAAGERNILVEAMQMGASAYIFKPFDTRLLMQTCEKLFSPGDNNGQPDP